MDDIIIDDVNQNGDTYLTEVRNKVFLQQGGVCTRFAYDKSTVMDMNTFLEKEVKNLSKMRHNTMEVFQLKDLSNNYASLILGDEVVKYNVTNVEQVPIDILAKELQVGGDEVFVPDLYYPIIQYISKEAGGRDITVLIPPTKRTMMFRFPRLEPLSLQLTLPEMWLRVIVDSTDTIDDIRLAVVKERCRRATDTTLYMLPLPHMYADGRICLGSSKDTGAKVSRVDKRTNGDLVEEAIDMLFDSNWSNHLIAGQLYDSIIGDAYEDLPKLAKITEAISGLSADRSMAQCLRCIRVLMHPTGYLKLNYTPLRISTSEFLSAR